MLTYWFVRGYPLAVHEITLLLTFNNKYFVTRFTPIISSAISFYCQRVFIFWYRRMPKGPRFCRFLAQQDLEWLNNWHLNFSTQPGLGVLIFLRNLFFKYLFLFVLYENSHSCRQNYFGNWLCRRYKVHCEKYERGGGGWEFARDFPRWFN